MTSFIQTSPARSLSNTAQDHYIAAEAPFSTFIKKGQVVRIEDTYGQRPSIRSSTTPMISPSAIRARTPCASRGRPISPPAPR